MKHLFAFLLCLASMHGFSQGYWPEYTKVKEERFGDGQYWESDAINYQNYPYTTFDQVGGISIEQQKQNIRDVIVAGMPTCLTCPARNEFYTIYKNLFDFAMGATPDNLPPDTSQPSKRASWAKARAFIYILNITPEGFRFDSMYDAGGFIWSAERALQTLAYDVPADADNLLTRSRELEAAVQAYDLMKMAGRLQNDRNHKDLTVRDNLRRFARNLFKQAAKSGGVLMSTSGYRRNHGISVCAALGTAAIVFNECGAGYWNDRWKAENWARLAHWGMMECLFDARDWFCTSQKGGIYGYSEGPGYFSYSMIGTAIPFFKTFNNFVTSSHNSWVSPYGWPSKGANNVKNYMHDEDIRHLYEWYFLIQRPNGAAPTYDNSHALLPNAIGIFDPAFNTGDKIFSLDEGNVDLRVDYLAALGGLGEQGKMRKSTSDDLKSITQLDGSGNMILRMNQDSTENRQYFMMLYEHGVAHDGGDIGGTHEDDDVGSFILGVDNDELTIDPAYLEWSQHAKTSKYLHHNVILFDNQSSMVDYFLPFMISLPSTNVLM